MTTIVSVKTVASATNLETVVSMAKRLFSVVKTVISTATAVTSAAETVVLATVYQTLIQ